MGKGREGGTDRQVQPAKCHHPKVWPTLGGYLLGVSTPTKVGNTYRGYLVRPDYPHKVVHTIEGLLVRSTYPPILRHTLRGVLVASVYPLLSSTYLWVGTTYHLLPPHR